MQLMSAEDYKAGDSFELGQFEVTREEVVEFAQNTTHSRFISMMKLPRRRFLVGSFRVAG